MVDVPMLMYHEVVEESQIEALSRRTQRGYILSCSDFERQLKFLADNGFTSILLPQLLDGLAGKCPLPAKPVAITFDDGFDGNHRYALPLLVKYGFCATFFVVTNRTGEPQMMSWEQLAQLQQAGMSVQSHTANHPLLSTLNAEQTEAELRDSKRALEQRLGQPVHFISLPNGDSNSHYVECAKKVGYYAGCSSVFGFNDSKTDPFFLRRIAVKHELGFERFSRLLLRDPQLLRAMRQRARAKAAVAQLLGKRNYDRIYNLVFGVGEQDRRKQVV